MQTSNTALHSKPVGLQNKQFAANYLQISVRTLDDLVKNGKVKAVRPSPGAVRFTVEALDEYIASLSK